LNPEIFEKELAITLSIIVDKFIAGEAGFGKNEISERLFLGSEKEAGDMEGNGRIDVEFPVRHERDKAVVVFESILHGPQIF
jgi:hypothetical protein